jgi:phage head maturation protease
MKQAPSPSVKHPPSPSVKLKKQTTMKTDEIKLHKREGFTAGGVQLREDGDQAKTIEGLAIVTNQETVLYEDAECREIEIVDPSCINADFLAKQDIKLNLLHERRDSFARTPNLRVFAGEDGLRFETAVPRCDIGQRAVALIGNGTYTGCSFEFYAKDYSISERAAADGKTEYVIRHTAFEKITALTIAMDPAYEQTDIKAREIYKAEHRIVKQAEPTAEEREAQAKAAAAKREQVIRDAEIARIHREMELLNQ